MARLTVSVSDETLERLRTLAGGERKVGVYLDEAIAWLWQFRQTHGATPLTELKLVDSDEEVRRMLAQAEENQSAVDGLAAQVAQLRQAQDAIVAFMAEAMKVSPEELRRLQAQEDSGDNDA